MENFILDLNQQDKITLNRLMNRQIFILLFLVVLILSAFLRFYQLDLRPLHHDEGHNAMWALVIKEGIKGHFEPGGRHGLLPHLLTTLAYYILGDNDFSVRFFASLGGLGLLALLYFFRGLLSNTGTIGSTLLLGFSPLMVYYSRFAINEIFLVFLNLALALFLYLWIAKGKKIYFVAIAGALALMVATKESWIINLAALGASLIITYYLHRHEFPPLKISSWLTLKILGAGIILFLFLVTTIYTLFFTKLQNLYTLYICYSFWVKEGLTGGGHTYPFLTYFNTLLFWEVPILLLAGVGVCLWLKFKDSLSTFLVFWIFFIWLAYSVISYKTPWLTINILLPIGLLAGRSLTYLWDYPIVSLKKLRILVSSLLLGALCLSLWKTIDLNFRFYDKYSNWVIYTQESRHIRKLYQRIYQVARMQDNPQNVKMDIFLGFYEKSPTFWYLRRFPGRILIDDNQEITQATILLFSDTTQNQITPRINPKDYETGRVFSYPGVVYHLWVKKEAMEQLKKKSQASKN